MGKALKWKSLVCFVIFCKSWIVEKSVMDFCLSINFSRLVKNKQAVVMTLRRRISEIPSLRSHLWDPISEIPSGSLPCDKSREKEECSCQKMTGNVRCGDMRHIRGLILTENCLLIAHSSENWLKRPGEKVNRRNVIWTGFVSKILLMHQRVHVLFNCMHFVPVRHSLGRNRQLARLPTKADKQPRQTPSLPN